METDFKQLVDLLSTSNLPVWIQLVGVVLIIGIFFVIMSKGTTNNKNIEKLVLSIDKLLVSIDNMQSKIDEQEEKRNELHSIAKQIESNIIKLDSWAKLNNYAGISDSSAAPENPYEESVKADAPVGDGTVPK
jgi:hypothetical protein